MKTEIDLGRINFKKGDEVIIQDEDGCDVGGVVFSELIIWQTEKSIFMA